jgi:hypothetical protein
VKVTIAASIAAMAWALTAQVVRSGASSTPRCTSRAASGALRSSGTALSAIGSSLEVHITMSPSWRPMPVAVAW